MSVLIRPRVDHPVGQLCNIYQLKILGLKVTIKDVYVRTEGKLQYIFNETGPPNDFYVILSLSNRPLSYSYPRNHF